MSEKGQTIAVKFTTQYEVNNPIHIIGVVGSISSLGCWNPEHCMRLHQVPSSRGHWEGTVSVSKNQPFEWKLVLLDRGTREVIRWEERNNRRTILKDGGRPEVIAPWCVSETVKYHDADSNITHHTEENIPQNDIYTERKDFGYDKKAAWGSIPKLTYDYNGDKRNKKAVRFPKPPVTDVIRYEKEEEKVNLTFPITATNGVEGRLRNKFEVYWGSKDGNYIADGGETSKPHAEGKAVTDALASAHEDDASISLRRRNSVEYQINRYLENQDSSSDPNRDYRKGFDDRAQSHNVIEQKADEKHLRLKLLLDDIPVNTDEEVDGKNQFTQIAGNPYFIGTVATVLVVSAVIYYRYLSI